MFSRYVVWQDYRRDLRAAALRSDFVARVSHELRTPLTSIRMLAETLSLGRIPEPDRQREYLDTIVRETERLSGMVENVLAFSRTEAAPAQRTFEVVELRRVVESTLAQLRTALDHGGFTAHLDCRETSPEVRADPEALRQAIANLITNSMKYSGDSKRIEVRVIRVGGEVRIEVADWGIGVPGRISLPHLRAILPRSSAPTILPVVSASVSRWSQISCGRTAAEPKCTTILLGAQCSRWCLPVPDLIA